MAILFLPDLHFISFAVKFLCTLIGHIFLIFGHHLLNQETNSTVLTTAWSWPILKKIHSATYHTILEAWLFPCIPMVISISSALNQHHQHRKKKKICFLFDFKVSYIFMYLRHWKSFLMPSHRTNPWFRGWFFSQKWFHCLRFCSETGISAMGGKLFHQWEWDWTQE